MFLVFLYSEPYLKRSSLFLLTVQKSSSKHSAYWLLNQFQFTHHTHENTKLNLIHSPKTDHYTYNANHTTVRKD